MRSSPWPVVCALACAACLWPAGASAIVNTPGGAEAPGAVRAATESGGSVSAVSLPHPLLSELALAKVVRPGAPPKVTLKLQESGGGEVLVEVALRSHGSSHASVVADVGWVRVGRSIVVAWPAGAKLRAGSYLLVVSGHDRHGEAVLAAAHVQLEAEVVVKAEPAKNSAPAPPASGSGTTGASGSGASTVAPAAGVPSPAQSAAEGAVFPVDGAHNFGGPENAFGAPRDGYSHQGQDVLTAEGTPVVAPYAGTIESTSYQEGGAGYYAVERTNVGFSFFYAHCEASSLAVSGSQTVAAGQLICRAGETGDATTPHLDFEIWIDGWRTADGYPINPLPYLEAWETDGSSG